MPLPTHWFTYGVHAFVISNISFSLLVIVGAPNNLIPHQSRGVMRTFTIHNLSMVILAFRMNVNHTSVEYRS